MIGKFNMLTLTGQMMVDGEAVAFNGYQEILVLNNLPAGKN